MFDSIGENVINPAWASVLCSPDLQKKVNQLDPVRVPIIPCCDSWNGTNMRLVPHLGREDFIDDGRKEEIHNIMSSVEHVASGVLHDARRVVLLCGEPGLGKTFLATHALHKAQAKFLEVPRNFDVKVGMIRGRGGEAPVEDLVDLGRSHGRSIGVAFESPDDVVLSALQHTFRTSRYVMLIDDANLEGLAQALRFIPVSEQRCSLIITSQTLSRCDIEQMMNSFGLNYFQFCKSLSLLNHPQCMKLMENICTTKSQSEGAKSPRWKEVTLTTKLLNKIDILDKTDRSVFKKLGFLPLAISLFANWSRMQFQRYMKTCDNNLTADLPRATKIAQDIAEESNQPFVQEEFLKDFDAECRAKLDCAADVAADELLQKWNNERDLVKECVLEANIKYSRGLLATVRLALQNLESHSTCLTECRQLLAFLSLCQPANVTWSLFDGGAEGEARLLGRGKFVIVRGSSLVVINSVGERCRLKTVGGRELDLNATVINDQIHDDDMIQIKVDNCCEPSFVSVSSIDFSPHEMIRDKETGKLLLCLRKLDPARNIKVHIVNHPNSKLNGKNAWIKKHVCSDVSCVNVSECHGWNDRTFQVTVEGHAKELDMRAWHLDLDMQGSFVIKDDQLFHKSEVPAKSVNLPETGTMGRVLQHNPMNQTVSVVFGCDTGVMSSLKPGSEEHRFKECDVQTGPIDDTAALVQSGVVDLLRKSGLVKVDKDNRKFHMHQLLQEAVRLELDHRKNLKSMQVLLQARCGQFGDEPFFDHRLYRVMREILSTVFDIVCRIRSDNFMQDDLWVTGMLLRIYELSRDVFGVPTKIRIDTKEKGEKNPGTKEKGEESPGTNMSENDSENSSQISNPKLPYKTNLPYNVLLAARCSLACNLVHLSIIRQGSQPNGTSMSLDQLLEQLRQRHPKIMGKTHFFEDDDLQNMLAGYWSRSVHASLVVNLARCFAFHSGKPVSPHSIANELLIKDIASLHPDFNLLQCLQNECASDPEFGVCFQFNDESALQSLNSDLYCKKLKLREMRWAFYTLWGSTDTTEEIERACNEAGEDAVNWSINVALGSALHLAGDDKTKPLQPRQESLQRALFVRLHTLGTFHPFTASTLKFLGKVHHDNRNYSTAIIFFERALGINMTTLGLHPATARIMSHLGQSYHKHALNSKSIELYERALSIYTDTLGMDHPNSADVNFSLSIAFESSSNLEQAVRFAKEAKRIRQANYGNEHSRAREAETLVKRLEEKIRQKWEHERHYYHENIPTSETSESLSSSCARRSNSDLPALRNSTSCGQNPSSGRYRGQYQYGARHGWGVLNYDNGNIYYGEFKQGKRHGWGKMEVKESGCYEEGRWENDALKPSNYVVAVKERGIEQGSRIYPDGRKYTGEWKDGEMHGQGKLIWLNQTKNYVGQFENGKMTGIGKCVWPSRDCYDGRWEDGKMNGLGTYTEYLTTAVRHGEFRDNMLNGQGEYRVDGRIYSGMFVNDKLTTGTCTLSDGRIFQGEFEDSWMRGTCKWRDGRVGEGEFENFVMNGEATLTTPSVEVYDGGWVDGKKHGKGTLTFSNGKVYDGNWMKDKKHGKGKLTTRSGEVYDGGWKNDMKHGEGKLTSRSLGDYDGGWKNDMKDGRGTLTFSNGQGYVGEWKDDMKHGEGKLTTLLSGDYDGGWQNNMKDGRGTLTLDNGQGYVGEWRDDMKHGIGTLTFSNGEVYYGNWVKDKKHGEGKLTRSGEVYDGGWKNDMKDGRGTLTFLNGEVFYGSWKDDKKHGTFNSIRLDGHYRAVWDWWEDDKKHETFKSICRPVDWWKDDKKQSIRHVGRYYTLDHWMDDHFHRQLSMHDAKDNRILHYIERNCSILEFHVKGRPGAEDIVKLLSHFQELEVAVITTAFNRLIIYLSNIVDNPEEPKFRTIKTTIAAYARDISPMVGVERIFETLSFIKRSSSVLNPAPAVPSSFVYFELPAGANISFLETACQMFRQFVTFVDATSLRQRGLGRAASRFS